MRDYIEEHRRSITTITCVECKDYIKVWCDNQDTPSNCPAVKWALSKKPFVPSKEQTIDLLKKIFDKRGTKYLHKMLPCNICNLLDFAETTSGFLELAKEVDE